MVHFIIIMPYSTYIKFEYKKRKEKDLNHSTPVPPFWFSLY